MILFRNSHKFLNPQKKNSNIEFLELFKYSDVTVLIQTQTFCKSEPGSELEVGNLNLILFFIYFGMLTNSFQFSGANVFSKYGAKNLAYAPVICEPSAVTKYLETTTGHRSLTQ